MKQLHGPGQKAQPQTFNGMSYRTHAGTGWIIYCLHLTESFGFGINTESESSFGLKFKAKSLRGFGFRFELNPPFKHPSPVSLKKGLSSTVSLSVIRFPMVLSKMGDYFWNIEYAISWLSYSNLQWNQFLLFWFRSKIWNHCDIFNWQLIHLLHLV